MKLRRASRRRPEGFTLLELILTLGVLVALAVIFWPTVLNWQEKDKLSRAVDDLRALLTGLRLRAMQDGRAVQFLIEPGSPNYQVVAAFADATATNVAAPTPGQYDEKPKRLEFDAADILGAHSLEEGLQFLITQPDDETLQGEPATQDRLGVRFEPDGSANDFQWQLVDQDGFAVQFRVRALTGIVTVGEPYRLPGYQGSTQSGVNDQ